MPVDLGPYKQRVLLAVLLCHANTVMQVDQLLKAVWEDEQPRTARKNLQVYVSALRKIAGDRIRHHPYGYVLRMTADELDLFRFDALVAAGRSVWRTDGDRDAAAALFRDALDLWRDRALVDLLSNAFVTAASARLDDRYLAVYEDWVDLEIAAGRHINLLERLSELAGRYPFRERLTAATMTALGRSGQRKAALAHYESHRQFIARELGLDPSPVLKDLYQQILSSDSNGQDLPPPRRAPARRADEATVQDNSKPAQLPRVLTDFVGRTAQVKAVTAALSESEDHSDVAVVSGMTGVGKTALAIHVGHLLADRFTDGQIFVSLRDDEGRPRPWRDVLTELMRGSRFPGRPPREEAIALAVWRSWVAERRFLFVLDDATSEACIRRLLPGRGANRTLVTSSRRLSGLESVHRVEISAFSSDETAALLERVLGKGRLIGADGPISRIMLHCGGLPLAIRTIAAKLTLHRHMSLHEYADQLDELSEVLGEFDVGDVSLHSRFQRFYAGLSPLQQKGFRALGTLPEPRSGHDSVVAALGGFPEPAGRVLEALMEANLVHSCDYVVSPHAIRYEIPTLVHQYAVRIHRGEPAH